MSGGVDPNAPTIAPEASAAAARFWEERQKGKAVSVDDVLATAPGTPDRAALRATVIHMISQQAATLSGSEDSSSASAPTIDGVPPSSGTLDPRLTTVIGAANGPLPTIEGYDLVACLGRGGMGAVYEGYQQSTGRRVAVKFMLDSLGAKESIRKRFEREVEVVARLQHPGIVSVLDSGVRRGRYFYVMDYVPGRPLEEALPPGKNDPREVLQLIARLCDAMDYAHQRGVLHRDLKPANVIVDEQGVPRLLDFGLAKTFDPAAGQGESQAAVRGLTISGPDQIMGTVAYMAPEQARGENDQTSVRTDIYSLGAIAYQLITGELPCNVTGSLREVLTRIIEIDPAAPSTIRRGLTRDLDAVLLKALEKQPERRYASAGEFAADIRRALAGQPVLARRVGTMGRSWRWVRRNRAVSAVAASAVIALVVVSTLLISRIIRESRIAAVERDIARENFNRFRTVLESVDPENVGGVSVLQLLDMTGKGLNDSPPKQEIAEAQLRAVLGTVYRKFGDYTQAKDHLSRVLAVHERRAAGRDDKDLAEALHNLAATYWWEGAYVQAEGLYSRALDMRRRLFPGDSSEVAFSLTHLAACRIRMGKLEESRALYQEALDMRKRLYKGDHREVAQSLNNLARAYFESDQLDRAEELFRQSLEMSQRLEGAKEHSGRPGTAFASMNLGDLFLRRSEAAEIAGDSAGSRKAARDAKDAYQRAADIRTEAFAASATGHHLLAGSLASLSRAQLRLGDFEDAEVSAGHALDMFRNTRRADHPDLADGLEAVAMVRAALDDAAGATDLLRQAIAIADKAHPPPRALLSRLRAELGLSLAGTASASDGERLVLGALEDTRATRGDATTDTILAARRVVEFYTRTAQPERASPFRALAHLQ